MSATVTLQVWQVRARDVPAAVVAGRAAAHRLRRHRDVSFVKVLGTSSAAFVPTAATPRRWATLVCRSGTGRPADSWWDRHAVEHASLTLRPLSSHGSWDGRTPFVVADHESRWRGPVVALTRATLRASAARRFYRAVPPVAAELDAATGCRLAFGIGEAPLLRQGTVSVWESAAAMRAFAYDGPRHAAVIAETPRQGWYAEQLFARFALVDATGTVDGSPLT